MKLSTFRSLSIGDKVTRINRSPEFVTNQFIQVKQGDAVSFVELANSLQLSESDAWLLADAVEHPSPELYN
jgi:hypothetical protein